MKTTNHMNGKKKIKQSDDTVENLPFSERLTKEGFYIRKFSSVVDSKELVWHRDREDRAIEVLSGDNWMLQLDNDIPRSMSPGSKFFIKKNTWHRVIKGNSDLLIKLTKLSD